MTARQLRNQRREAERKARKLQYRQNRSTEPISVYGAVAELPDDTSHAGPIHASPAPEPNSGPTGPRTPEGKAISSSNSLKHGLASGRLIIPGEDRADFDALLTDLVAEHAPATPTEEMLVQQMAQSWWLMHRALRIQNQAFLETCCDMKKLALFLRYQTTYERAFYRALNSLKKLQKDRLASTRDFVSQKCVGATHASPEFVSQKPNTAPKPVRGVAFQAATPAFGPAYFSAPGSPTPAI